MPLHREQSRLIGELLGDVLADARKRAATAAAARFGLVVHGHPRQVRGQRLAAWLESRSAPRLFAQLLELLLDRGQIAVEGFLQQARLHGIELLAGARKAQPLVARQLVGELFDARALEQQLALE